jgi:hypothetical protein
VDANKICKRFTNVKLLDMSSVSRAYHTEDGRHLNGIDKEYISKTISSDKEIKV